MSFCFIRVGTWLLYRSRTVTVARLDFSSVQTHIEGHLYLNTSSLSQNAASRAVLRSAPLRLPLGLRLRSHVWLLSAHGKPRERLSCNSYLPRAALPPAFHRLCNKDSHTNKKRERCSGTCVTAAGHCRQQRPLLPMAGVPATQVHSSTRAAARSHLCGCGGPRRLGRPLIRADQ